MDNNEKIMMEIINLKKYFGKFKAVDGISFNVNKGEFFAFLGPNGAGKSTSINCISTIIAPTSGEVIVNGQKISENKLEVRKNIGLVFQENVSDGALTIKENLRIHGELYGMSRTEIEERTVTALDVVELSKEANKKVSALSGGMKRRVEVAKAILHQPKMLLLDEPTAGLDPQTRLNMWNFLMELKEKTGMTIMLTTHHMDEAEQCDRIAIIDHGKMIALDTPTNLADKHTTSKVNIKTHDESGLMKFCDGIAEVKRNSNEFSISVSGSITEFVKKLCRTDIEFTDIAIHRPKLTDVFINLTGKEYRD